MYTHTCTYTVGHLRRLFHYMYTYTDTACIHTYIHTYTRIHTHTHTHVYSPSPTKIPPSHVTHAEAHVHATLTEPHP